MIAIIRSLVCTELQSQTKTLQLVAIVAGVYLSRLASYQFHSIFWSRLEYPAGIFPLDKAGSRRKS